MQVEPEPEHESKPIPAEPQPQPIPVEPKESPESDSASEPDSVSSCMSPILAADWTYDPDLALEMQMRCIITCDLPFHAFDTDRSTVFIQSLQPKYERVSQTTLLRHAFKAYLEAKKELIEYFQTFQSKVSLTIHVWETVYTGCPYICITCHWIDPGNWKMSKRIITLENIPFTDYYGEVYDIISACISQFKIKDKILSITLDDFAATRYAPSIEKLKSEINPMFDGGIFRTKCVSHILNSMVRSCLGYVAPVILKFENMHEHLFISIKREEFKKFVLGKGERYRHPLLPVPDDWNTTYKWLGKIVGQKPLFVEFYATCDENDIDDNDWEIVESLLDILENFHASTVLLSDAYNPTTPLVLGETLLIANMFKKYKQQSFWEPHVSEMQTKLLRYYETMPPIFSCAAALNPTLGLGGVENILEDIAAELSLDFDSMNASKYATVSMMQCSAALREVFDCYERAYRSRPRKLVPVTSTSRKIILQSVSRKKVKTLTIRDELELYTKTDFSNIMNSEEYESLKILEWWRDKGRHQYPVLAEMVRDLLTVQASSLGSEYAFFLNGRVLDEKTSLQPPRWLEKRLFLKEHFNEIDKEEDPDCVEHASDDSSDGEFLH